MKILVIGSGGREHALVYKISQSPLTSKIYAAPGSDAISNLSECVAIGVDQIEELTNFAQKEAIDLTVVGPELPLSLGIVDAFENKGLKIFGPRQNAAIIEASKVFTKQFCARHNIPTAAFEIFNTPEKAKQALNKRKNYPVVLKADGLAAGKGVIIAKNKAEASNAIDQMMVERQFGSAGNQVVIEEFLPGQEATFTAISDGQNYVVFSHSQDHKPIGEGDTGLNTGGMGAYSPAPLVSKEIEAKVVTRMIEPLIKGMALEERPYKGVIYAGLMINQDNEPFLVEYNARFGDPEAQCLLYRLKSDLVEMMLAVIEGRLDQTQVEFEDNHAVCVVMASKGYPKAYQKGAKISGLDETQKQEEDVFVFHAGTKKQKDQWVNSGGRVLGVTAKAASLKEATQKAYNAVEKINWQGAYFRRDIAAKAL